MGTSNLASANQSMSPYYRFHHSLWRCYTTDQSASNLSISVLCPFLRRLITIYDVKIELKWSGKASDGTEVDGKLAIPEVSHEVTLDGLSEYVVRHFFVHPRPKTTLLTTRLFAKYDWTLSTKSSKPVDSLYQLARQRLPIALEAKFAEFPAAIIETHGKDLTVSAEPSRTGTPVQATNVTSSTPTATTTGPTPKAKNQPKKATAVNTSTVEVEATFQASADDLFSIFTDEKRIPAWTRAPALASPIFRAYIHTFNLPAV